MQALILAAGLGTRLGALTADLPKCMLPVAGRPLVEHLVRLLVAHDVRDLAINLHHRPEAIVDHLGDGAALGARITYSREERLLGTAGAAKRLEHYFDGSFLVVYGDGFTNVDLGRLVRAHAARAHAGPHATLLLYRVPNPTACGLVDLASGGRVRRFVEKPPPHEVFTDLASAGILILDRELLGLVPADRESDLGRDLLPLLVRAGLAVYGEELLFGEYLVDIGTPESYCRASTLARVAEATPAMSAPNPL